MIASQVSNHITLFFTISFEHRPQSELQKKAKEYLEAKSGGGGEDDSNSKPKGKKRKRRGSGDSDGSDVSSDDEDEAPPGMKDQAEEQEKKVNMDQTLQGFPSHCVLDFACIPLFIARACLGSS